MKPRMSLQLSEGSNQQSWMQFLALMLLCMFAGSSVAGGPSFYDYARVLNADPIRETVAVPVKREHCFYPTRAIRAVQRLAGDVRSAHPNIKIGAAITEEIEHRNNIASMRRCRSVTAYDNRDKVVAYRVRYEYGGDIFVRRMRQHPGEQVMVRVNLTPR